MTSLRRTAPRQELAIEVYEILRANILDGSIPPGARIKIEDAAELLSVSPTPVRESLARLESEGLVLREPRRGYRTTELLNAADVADLYELRLLLEPYAAQRAALGAQPELLQLLAQEMTHGKGLTGATGSLNPAELSAHDERFHDLIFQASGNDLIRRTYQRTHCHLHIFRLSFSDTFDSHTIVEHEAIAQALQSANPELAAQAMEAHILSSKRRIESYFESHPQG